MSDLNDWEIEWELDREFELFRNSAGRESYWFCQRYDDMRWKLEQEQEENKTPPGVDSTATGA